MGRYSFIVLPAVVVVAIALVVGAVLWSGGRAGGAGDRIEQTAPNPPPPKGPPAGHTPRPATPPESVEPGQPTNPVSELASRLRDPALDPAERLRLIREAGQTKDGDAMDALMEALKDKNAIVRGEAAEALGRIGGARARDALIAALEDPNPTVRQRAALALGLLGSAESGPKLLAALTANRVRPDGYGLVICQEIVRSLGRLKDRGAVDALIAEMGLKQDLSYKNDVVRSLGSIGDPRAADVIRTHLAWLEGHKPTEKIQQFPWQEAVNIAKEALRQLGEKQP